MKGTKNRIAILMTCHNRRETTLSCLKAVFKQVLPESVTFNVFLVDDGSTDGTGDAVRSYYPSVAVLEGDGSLFWNRGMRKAFAEAMERDFDYYLWLNDDTILYTKALKILLETVWKVKKTDNSGCIIAGSICDPESGVPTYGGLIRYTRWHPLNFRILKPRGKPLPCHTMNGNCILIPGEVAKAVGNLDGSFSHSIGDTDYGLRAVKKGFSILISPEYVGTCERKNNSIYGRNQKMTLRELIKKVNQPTGLPFKEWMIYTGRYTGIFWPFYWVRPYVNMFLKATMLSILKCFRKKI
ncbi:MAG TPA: glycosyltransferase family 2 protein [Candidatus Eremiobacteraeota bacterium]|nr:MAG: N-glycosyltransferase [bacterium ADurb.Bin363]HPZ07368.1 glycosyltransferase family 2 protein [Candidatus Eremiobacteraeota bacterium]